MLISYIIMYVHPYLYHEQQGTIKVWGCKFT